MLQLGIAVAGVLLTLITLPALVELTLFLFANVFMRGRLRRRGAIAAPSPIRKLAVLVPAHDEKEFIGRTVASLLDSDPGPYQLEVVVIADNCGDSTAQIAAAAGARVIERFDDRLRGKGAALQHAIALLMPEDHDAFIIIDADSVVDPSFVKTMGDGFASGHEAQQCVYLPLNVDASPKIQLMNLSFLSINYFRPFGRELLGLSAGIVGNGFGLTKRLLAEVPYTANSIAEDIEYHLMLVESGHRVRFTAQARVLGEFPVSTEGSGTQRARWEGGRVRLQRAYLLPLLGKILSGRLELLEPFLGLMSLPLSYEVLLLGALVLMPWPLWIYGLAGLILVAAHLPVAVGIHGRPRDFAAMLEIPRFGFWKIVMLPKILMSSGNRASWVRTKRD